MAGNLTTVYSWTLILNNMLSVSLMRDNESKYNRYFAFFNLTPGTKKDDGTRTYDFKNGISFKIGLERLFEIHTTITFFLTGRQASIQKFSIINDTSKSSYSSGSGLKTLHFNLSKGDEKNVPGILLIAKSGDRTIPLNIPTPAAMTVAEMCKKIFDLAMKIDMDEYQTRVGNGNSFGGQSSSNYAASEKRGQNAPAKSESDPFGGSEDGTDSFDTNNPF